MTRSRPGTGTDEAIRTLPWAGEAERSVIGAALVHNPAFEAASEVITQHDFFRVAHQRIWQAIAAVIGRRAVADLVTVKEELARTGDLEDIGGASYLSGLTDGVPRATNAKHYAGIVREKSLLRGLIKAGQSVVAEAYDAEDSPVEILRRADKAFLELQGRRSGSRMQSVGETVSAFWQRLERRTEQKGEVTGVTTGYPQINGLTNGWQKKDVVIIAARPSIGKTVMAVNSATAAALAGHPAAIFSYEMRREQLEDRLLSNLTQVELTRIQNGHLGRQDYGLITPALEVLGKLPLYIDDRAGQYVSDIRNTCRRLQGEHGLDLVVIDYVQLIPCDLGRRGANKNDQITEISRQIKELADELDVPILLLSQLNRPDERRSDPRPKLTDLRESGSLEQDADEVNFLWRPDHKLSGTTVFMREKARNGPTGTVNLTINRDTVTFFDGGDDIPEPHPKQRQTVKRNRWGTADLPLPDDGD